jgi:predicted AlkP superfamily pyrophosphatase or phosphodiesterase
VRLALALLAALVLAACRAAAPPAAPLATAASAPADTAAPLVLVSIDGFRPDYRATAPTPTLDRLAAEGVRAERLVPVFPTLTFPNHYSLVTGLHPEEHGIVGNSMFDPAFAAAGTDSTFSLGDREALADGRWWGGEPIWVTAEREGIRTAPLFWPGSEAEIGGVRPSVWHPYDGDLPYEARVDSVLAWLDRPAETRPGFAALYVSAVDHAGHDHGPDAPETAAAVAQADRVLARLVAGLEARGLYDRTNLVVVSDHGMAALAPDRVAYLDDAVDLEADLERILYGATTLVWPRPGREDAVVEALRGLDHVTVYRREEVPERLHFRDHRRIAPVVVVADVGWTLTTRDYVERRGGPTGGTHGYDNAAPEMAALLVARGPAFRSGAVVDEVSSVDLYNVMAAALGLRPAPNSGDPAALPALLRPVVAGD